MDTPPNTDAATPRPQSPSPPSDAQHYPDVEARELQRLTADISARIRRVCAHMPDDEFAALVMDIARVRLRYEQRVFGHSTDGARRADD